VAAGIAAASMAMMDAKAGRRIGWDGAGQG
jgi:hypothetical protein